MISLFDFAYQIYSIFTRPVYMRFNESLALFFIYFKLNIFCSWFHNRHTTNYRSFCDNGNTAYDCICYNNSWYVCKTYWSVFKKAIKTSLHIKILPVLFMSAIWRSEKDLITSVSMNKQIHIYIITFLTFYCHWHMFFIFKCTLYALVF